MYFVAVLGTLSIRYKHFSLQVKEAIIRLENQSTPNTYAYAQIR